MCLSEVVRTMLQFFYIYSQNRHPENLYCTFGNCEEDFPKKPVGRLSADTLPTVYRQATDSFPKKKIVEKTRIKHDIETIIISIDITYLLVDGKTISLTD